MKPMQSIIEFLKKNFKTVLIVEIILFVVIIIVSVVYHVYVSEYPFFDFQHTSSYDFAVDIFLSRVFGYSYAISFILIVIFPFLFIIQVIFLAVFKLINKRNIAYLILIVLLYIANLFACNALSIRDSIKIKAHNIYYPYVNHECVSDTLDLQKFVACQEYGWSGLSSSLDSIYTECCICKKEISDSIYIITTSLPKSYYKLYQSYYDSGKIRDRGLYLCDIKIYKWEYYDRDGNKDVKDEDCTSPFKHTYKDLLHLLHKEGCISIGSKFCIQYKNDALNKGKPYWCVEIEEGSGELMKILFDARTGKIVADQ